MFKYILVCLVPFFLYAQSGVLLRVIDGDTLLLKTQEGFSICQASFIDAPEAIENDKLDRELRKCNISKEYALSGGEASKEFVNALLQKSTSYSFEITRVLPNQNPVCDIKLPKKTQPDLHPRFSEVLVENGFALPYIIHADEKREEDLLKLAKFAKKEKRGLWKTHHDLMMCLVYQRYSLRSLRE